VSVELRELRWAIVASQRRSLRRAAEALNIRQSTLSRCLRDLEYKLGAALFERTNGGTRPTTEGLEFLESARRIVEETETIVHGSEDSPLRTATACFILYRRADPTSSPLR
jgi:DNA-binding transcriptional LysR family regulator